MQPRVLRALYAAAVVWAAAFLFAPIAYAQGVVQQVGPVTYGHGTMWLGTGQIMDAGGPRQNGQPPVNNTNPGTSPLGYAWVNSGLGDCGFSNYAKTSYSRLCWGFDGSGNGLFALDGFGTDPSLSFRINGTTYQFPGTGNGNVVGPTPTTVGDVVTWANSAGTLVGDGGKITPVVATNAALTAAATTDYPNGVTRQDFAVNSGAAWLDYRPSSLPCPLNAGDGDNISQVKSRDGKCWLWVPPSAGVTPLEAGAKGDGTTDDSGALQAAIDATAAAGIPLIFDDQHLYFTNDKTLNVKSPFVFDGPYQLGPWVLDQTAANYGFCKWGLKASNSGGAANTMFNISALSGTFGPLCMQMMDDDGTHNASAGAAINIAPPNVNDYITGLYISRPTIVNPYEGIAINGAGYSSGCCGKGTAIAVTIDRPRIISPAHVGIAVGENTAGASTAGITVYDSDVICRNPTSQASGTAIRVNDGALGLYNTTIGPLGCAIGVLVDPGTISGVGQNAQIYGQGVMCDQCTNLGIFIQPSTSLGVVSFTSFNQCWVTPSAANKIAVGVANANGGSVYGLKFTNCDFHTVGSATSPLVQITGNGATGSLSQIVFSGNAFMCWGGNCSAGAPMLYMVASQPNQLRNVTITGNSFQVQPGVTMDTAIKIEDAGGNPAYITITGNDFQVASHPLIYANAVSSDVGPILTGNTGINDTTFTAASASGVLIQPYVVNLGLSGTTTITSLEVPWQGRVVNLFTSGPGLTLGTGGTYPFCASTTLATGKMVTATWISGASCWYTN